MCSTQIIHAFTYSILTAFSEHYSQTAYYTVGAGPDTYCGSDVITARQKG